MNITFTASPNFNERTGEVNMIVLHYTGMESGDAALERMCDPESKVSAHFMVWEDGEVSQLVGEDKRAWHAGVGGWKGDGDINSCSIGIEIVNGGHNVPRADGSLPPYPETQIQSVIALCDYCARATSFRTRGLSATQISRLHARKTRANTSRGRRLPKMASASGPQSIPVLKTKHCSLAQGFCQAIAVNLSHVSKRSCARSVTALKKRARLMRPLVLSLRRFSGGGCKTA